SMTRSARGLSFLAVREDEIASLSIGISTTHVKVRAFIIGAFFAGVGGGLFAHLFTSLNINQFGFLRSIEYVVMVVLGGLGSLWGVAIATIFLTSLPEVLRTLGDRYEPVQEVLAAFPEWRMVVYSLL